MRSRTGLVLVVEDEANVREPLAHLLQLRDFQVVTADCVADALKMLSTHRPDAAIVDLRLRCGSGREVVSQVPSTVPVIIFSGNASETGNLEQVRPRTRFVEKPCSLTWLVNTLNEMIESTRARLAS